MVWVSVGLAVRDSNVSLGSVFSPTCFSLFIYEIKKYILHVTLADEYTNSILTGNANGAIQGNVAMQVAPPGGQNYNECK